MNYKILRSIFLGCVLFFQIGSTSSLSADPLTAAMVGQSVNSVIDNLKTSINDVINNLDTVINKRSFDMRTHLLVVLQNLEYIGNNLGNEIFDNISKQQQQFLTNTQVILTQFKSGNMEQIQALRSLTGDMESALATLPLSKQFPIVREYLPSFVPVDGSETFVVSIIGSWIGNKDPTLVFPNGECSRSVKIDRNIKFNCSKKILGEIGNKTLSVTGNLTVYGEKSFWEKVKNIFSENLKKRKYEISITAVPSSMGNVEVLAIVEVEKQEIKNRTETYSWRNSHCSGGRTPCDTFNQTNANWKIIPSTVANHCDHQSTKSRCLGIRNKTESSFQACGSIQNNGSCVRALGQTISRDGRGVVNGHVTWQETRKYQVKENKPLGDKNLFWNKGEVFQLPPNSVAFQLKVNQLNKAIIIADKIGDYEWFTISKDVSSNQLIIQPKKLDMVFK